MHRALFPVAVALLAATAGCGMFSLGTPTPGPAADGRASGASETTVTPTGSPTPSPTSTPTPTGYPPGVTESGLDDVRELLAANRASLGTAGYVLTARTNMTIVTTETRIRRSVRTTERGASDGPAVAERTVVNNTATGNRTIELWGDDSVAFVREQYRSSRREPTTSYRTYPSGGDALTGASGTTGALLLLEVLEFDVADRSGGRTSLTAAGINRTAFDRLFGENGSAEAASADLVVGPNGRIRSFEGRLEADPGENGTLPVERMTVAARWELTTGEVAVERPDWVSAARAAVPSVTVSAEVVDGRYVTVTNEGPDAIPAGAQIGLDRGNRAIVSQVDDPVEPGDSVYVYRTDGRAIVVAREPPDGSATELSGTFGVRIRADESVLANATVSAGG